MGMPISNYTVLEALSGKNASSFNKRIALKALSPFNLFAFIIHDPQTHFKFNRQVSFQFDHLDFVTGHKLLFFAVIDPPTDWLDHAGHRRYYEQIISWETKELLNPQNAIVTWDKPATAFSLANSLRIPIEDLPCIIVTNDFRSKRFLWFKTCPEHLEEQLIKLGKIAARLDRRKPEVVNSDLLENIQQNELDLCNGYGEKSLESNLAKALSDVLSFIIAGYSSDSLQYQASIQAKKTISELQNSLNNLKRNFDESEAEELDKLCLNIVLFFSLLNDRSSLNLSSFVPIDENFLENDSYQILKTALNVFKLLTSEDRGTRLHFESQESFDFTPVVICLAKVFEKEVNLSIVHWIRKELGISLPQYFNKPQPYIQATYSPQGRVLDFNMNRNGKWLPPGMGESQIACKRMARNGLPNGWDKPRWDFLIHNWKVIKNERNKAAHTEIVDRTSLDIVKNSLKHLATSSIFEKFYQMKKEFSGR